METECDSTEEIRDAYERAIANVPPLAEKRSWRRYIYLWINYAIFEELQAKVHRSDIVFTNGAIVVLYQESFFLEFALLSCSFIVFFYVFFILFLYRVS